MKSVDVAAFVLLPALAPATACARRSIRIKHHFAFHFVEEVFHAEVTGARFNVAGSAARGPETGIKADPNLLGGLAVGNVELDAALHEGQVRFRRGKAGIQGLFDPVFPAEARAKRGASAGGSRPGACAYTIYYV